jgi:hypothetical protein
VIYIIAKRKVRCKKQKWDDNHEEEWSMDYLWLKYKDSFFLYQVYWSIICWVVFLDGVVVSFLPQPSSCHFLDDTSRRSESQLVYASLVTIFPTKLQKTCGRLYLFKLTLASD